MSRPQLAVLVAAMTLSASVLATEPDSISLRRMGLELALRAAQQALASCRAQGLQVGVTVVDRSGQVQVALRDVLAPQLTLQVSQLKAYTAVSFNAPTSQLERQGNSGLAHVPGLLFQAGAVPIAAGGTLYGAIGVSGAPLGSGDEVCAAAGAAAVATELELQ